jgi:hypothetical protein
MGKKRPLMSYLTAILILSLSVAAAAVLSRVVHRNLHIETRQRHHEVGNAVFLQVGVMFAVLLAFVFNETWGEYNTASQAINGECAALHGAAMVAATVPGGGGRAVDQAILAYGQEVVHTEWPMMAQRHRDPEAGTKIRAIIVSIAGLDLRPADASSRSEMFSLISQAHSNRETRIFQMTDGLPFPMWVVIFALSLVLVGSVLLAGVEAPAHLVFSGAFTGCIVLVLLLVRMLDYPFEGALTLGNGDFLKMITEVTVLANGS